MSPPIQGDGGRRLVLDWSYDRARGVASAQVGPYWLHAGDPGTSAKCWWTLNPGNRRNYGKEGRANTLLDAQRAAEVAARDLLCSAMAAFADEMGPDVCLNWDIDGEPGMGTYDHYAATSPKDARALAFALLSASQAGGGK